MTGTEKPERAAMNDSRTPAASDTRLTRAGSPPVHGWTYFFEDGGLIKIGFSVRPRHRLAQHRRRHPNLKVLAVVPTSIAGEFETHQRFDHLREDGEMFRAEPELYTFIDGVKALSEALPQPAEQPKLAPQVPALRKTMSELTVLRNQHKADSAIGSHCSNIMRLIQMPNPPAFQLKRQMDGLHRAMQAAQ